MFLSTCKLLHCACERVMNGTDFQLYLSRDEYIKMKSHKSYHSFLTLN